MQKYLFVISLFCYLALASCQPSLHSEVVEIPSGAWKKDKPVEFKATINDISLPVSINLVLRHSSNTLYHHVNVAVTMTSPSGKKEQTFHTFDIRDKATGELKGDATGDFCDTELVVYPSLALTEKGNYTFSVRQEMEEQILPLMLDISLKVVQIKK